MVLALLPVVNRSCACLASGTGYYSSTQPCLRPRKPNNSPAKTKVCFWSKSRDACGIQSQIPRWSFLFVPKYGANQGIPLMGPNTSGLSHVSSGAKESLKPRERQIPTQCQSKRRSHARYPCLPVRSGPCLCRKGVLHSVLLVHAVVAVVTSLMGVGE